MVKNLPANAEETGLIPGLGGFPGGGHGHPFQYSCSENYEQKSLAGYSPQDCKESNTTEHTVVVMVIRLQVQAED